MATKKKQKQAPVVTGRREIFGLILLGLDLLLLFSLFTYRPEDIAVIQSPPNDPPMNMVGLSGAWVGFLALNTFGLGAYLLPVVVLVVGVLCMLGREIQPDLKVSHKLGWMMLALVGFSCMMELMDNALQGVMASRQMPFAGGLVGHLLGEMILIRLTGEVGAGILLGLTVLVAAVCLFDFPVSTWIKNPRAAWLKLWALIQEAFAQAPGEEMEEELPLEELPVKKKRKPRKKKTEEMPVPEEDPIPALAEEDPLLPEPSLEFLDEIPEPEPEVESIPEPEPFPEPEPEPEPVVIPEPEPEPEPVAAEPSIFEEPAQTTPKPEDKPDGTMEPFLVPESSTVASEQPAPQWKLPPVTMLAEPAGSSVGETGAREEQLKRHLEQTLKQFGVEASVSSVQRGPVVTSFEVLPAPGVRVEKISNLSNNLALALKAESIRVQAPIPGKGVVGIEVPNGKSSVVFAREIIDSQDWAKSKDWRKGKIALPLCVGVDVSGRQLVGDLADMPHMLIAGATGSGKSVCMNSLLAGLLMSRTPDQLRLILVDPKIVEFTAFQDLPHLVVPVITDPKKVGHGLRWAITEMEKRYKLFAKVGVRNIRSFNTRPRAKQQDLFHGDAETGDKHPDTLPYIVIVIDELADLMMVAQQEIEGYIARLAQLSRAVGIHMILATQRPSVNVITGTIKANFPARIAFQVAQKVDSRTILDAIGADKLLGKGDMLFLSPGSAKLQRAQGAWTADEEINEIVAFIKNQGQPEYETQVTEKLVSKAPDLPEQDEDDELINQAIEVIRQTRRASTSSLQRRLRIGYNRAARLMDTLEEKQIIGPPQGSDPREILIDLDGEIPQNEPE